MTADDLVFIRALLHAEQLAAQKMACELERYRPSEKSGAAAMMAENVAYFRDRAATCERLYATLPDLVNP